jgi:peroxiredoxin
MQRFKFSPHLITFSLTLVLLTAVAGTVSEKNSLFTVKAQQVGPRKYLIKPLNLGINTEIRARSTRNLQVRVTDENDQPVPDAPVLFLLSGGGAGSTQVGSFAGGAGSTQAGSVAGQTSLRAMTNSQGIAQVDFTAGELEGSSAKLNIQVEGTKSEWEGTLLIISALAAPSAPKKLAEPLGPIKAAKRFGGLVVGQLPPSSLARHTYTTTEGKRFSLETMRGKVLVLHFFGPWCDISRRQVQAINNFLAGSNAEELQVIGMSVKDSRSTPLIFLQFMTDQKVTYWVVQDVPDKHFAEFVNSKDISVPQTLIYGRDGRVIAHFLGYNQQVGAEIEQKIKDALVK